MKYVILETPDGRKLPIIFPDALTHSLVAGAMQLAVAALNPKNDLRPKQCDALLERASAPPISAGFVHVGIDIATNGESESLGGLASQPADAARIVLGDAGAYLEDDHVASVFSYMQKTLSSAT